MDRYEEALSRAKKELQNCDPDDYPRIMRLFPELEENIRKSCIRFLETQKQHLASSFDPEIDECINWLKGCYPNPKFQVGDVMRTHKEAEDNLTDGMPVVCSVDGEYYHCNNELIAIKDQDNYEFPPINRKPKPSGWTKEDEENLAYIVGALDAYNSFRETRGNFSGQEKLDAAITWLKNLRKTAPSENS